jgi:threonine/homoserine/homoserine lactone efflux protein
VSSVDALLRGLAFGFAVAATPGPIFFLCLRRSLDRGPVNVIVSGLGVATADGFYAAVAAFGIAAVSTVLIGGRHWLGLAGGAVLIMLGVRILIEKQRDLGNQPQITGKGLAWAYASTLGLTITNPATIISFAALAAAIGVGAGTGLARPSLLVAGVFIGSVVCWCLLASGSSLLRPRLTPRVLRGISVASGVVIALLGLAAMVAA